MIIAIGGRMGSGKNTVCDIIQDLCNKHNGPNFEQKAFAGKLKQIASLLTGVPVEKFEDQDFKQSCMGEQWAKTPIAPLSEATLFDAVDLNNLMTYREFLQKLGTEAMRDGLHTNVWVNALFADYKGVVKEWDEFGNDRVVKYPNWIITDMRFPNEMEAVKERKGITIRVSRTGIHTPKIEDLHPSETALDDCEFDYHIDNSGTIEELIEKVREILINEKLL